MTYSCKHCNFRWNSWQGNFQKVLDHEETHLKDKTTLITGKEV